MSDFYGRTDEATGLAVIHRAIELGVAILDTADDVAMPGAKRRERLEENVAATEARLTAEELARIGALFPPGAFSGERYDESDLRSVDA